MNMHVNLLLTWLWIMHEAYPSAAENDFPKQEQCLTRYAAYYTADLVQKFPKEWWVARATRRTILPTDVPEPTMNSCAPMNYSHACQGGMHVENNWDKDGGLIKIIKAYSKQYDNIVEYWESVERKDTNFFVYGGFGTSMTLHFKDGKKKNIPTYDFPNMVVYTQARWYAMTQFGYMKDTGEVEWLLFQACDEDFAWIEIAQWVIDANRLEEVNEVIDDYLSTELLAIPQMVKLKLELPFPA